MRTDGHSLRGINGTDRWTVVIEVTSADVNTETIRRRLDLIEGVECVAISFDEDDAAHVLGPNAGTLTIDTRSTPSACGRLMVGSGTDSYDPICELPEGHAGSCRSTGAIDQHRLSAEQADAAWGIV